MVSVFTTVVFVTGTNARVTASHAPNTWNRCRPRAARTNHAPDRPQATQVRAVHAVGGIHEPHVPAPGNGRIQARFQLGAEELTLGGDVLGQVFLGGIGIARTRV